MQNETQISAVISVATKDLLERHARATGVKKGRLIEDALLHHLLALQEIPADMVVHPRIVVDRPTGERILARIKSPKPTKALVELMRRRGD